MIAKADWFRRRKYLGWGLSPATWQGWLYIAFIILPLLVFQALPFWGVKTRIYVTCAWLVFVFVDVNQAMLRLKKDERESKIEAIGDRNAAWSMVMVLIIGILYELITSALQNTIKVDWFMVATLMLGVVVKTVSNLYLERNPL